MKIFKYVPIFYFFPISLWNISSQGPLLLCLLCIFGSLIFYKYQEQQKRSVKWSVPFKLFKLYNIYYIYICTIYIYMHAKSLQYCLTLCNLTDYSPPGSSLHGSLQARILELVAMPSFSRSSWPRDQTYNSYGSCIAGRFFTTEPPGKPHKYRHICFLVAQIKRICLQLWDLGLIPELEKSPGEGNE